MEIGYWPNTPIKRLEKAYKAQTEYGNGYEMYFKMYDFIALRDEIRMKGDIWNAYFTFKKYSVIELKYKDKWIGVHLDRKARVNYVIKNNTKRCIDQ